jgi:SAM-dependent methyltransferase
VTEEWLRETSRPVRRARIDVNVPNVARVWNYLIGGRDNFESDRKAARQLLKAAPVMAHVAPASRAFLRRAVRYLAAEAGTRQFLDIGTGIPAAGSLHQVVQDLAPDSRVVYVDNDPVVLSHARALLRAAPEGAASFVEADARDPRRIIAEAGKCLDFGEPVGVVMTDLLNFIGRDAEVRSILSAVMAAVCPGSYLVVMHPASDLDARLIEAARRWNKVARAQVTLRGRDEVAAWFADLEVVDPGVVTLSQWRPDAHDPPYDGVMPLYGVVAAKPRAPDSPA